MELCIIRHAPAVDRGAPGYERDADRPLTDRGKDKMERAAHGLSRLWAPGMVVSSPFVRARETAEIVQAACSNPPLRFSDALATGDHEEVLEDVRDLGRDAVAVVGHEPWVSGLLSFVLTGRDHAMAAPFKKGAAALVRFAGDAPAAGSGELAWFLQPAALRRLAKRRD